MDLHLRWHPRTSLQAAFHFRNLHILPSPITQHCRHLWVWWACLVQPGNGRSVDLLGGIDLRKHHLYHRWPPCLQDFKRSRSSSWAIRINSGHFSFHFKLVPTQLSTPHLWSKRWIPGTLGKAANDNLGKFQQMETNFVSQCWGCSLPEILMSLSHNRCHLFLQDEAGCCAATLLLEKQIQVLEMESASDTHWSWRRREIFVMQS